MIAPVAVISGHILMMREGGASQPGAKKIIIGTVLGYLSLLVFLVLAVVARFVIPMIEKAASGG